MRYLRTLCAAIAGATVIGVLAACSTPAPRPKPLPKPPTSYYLSLGDSLSLGMQPNAIGVLVQTRQGYPNQLYATLRQTRPGLRLVHLGCSGETTKTMINGGICQYPGGSQLAAATAFLRAHRGHVPLVTLDIGANDPQDCVQAHGLALISSCITAMPEAATNLARILTALRTAAGPGVHIVGMSYYLPELAEWRNGLFGHVIARTSEGLAATYSKLLTRVYTKAGIPVANVFGAFDTSDFGSMVTVRGLGTIPHNLALLCQWTWQCAPPPRGPNEHANAAGYTVIATAFLHVINDDQKLAG
jgi:lysophospholipase L1-like esterase